MPKRISKRRRILNLLNGRSIVLLGMMGCGKSAIGRMLARKLTIDFKDADSEIEAAAGLSVSEIFAQYGEEEFRRLEERVIERILSEGPVLLALGGGAFMSEQIREIVSQKGLSIWIKADLDVLLSRVKRKPGKRPLLKQGNPRDILKDLLEKREPIYSLAQLHVNSINGTKSVMRDHLLNELQAHLEKLNEQ